MITIRSYEPADLPALAELFYDTVHTVNAGDYSPEQLDAWASGKIDLEAWDRSLRDHCSLVAVMDGQIVGVADMDHAGYLDRLYVHRDHQRQGIATTLCDCLEGEIDTPEFSTHASITARPFFERRGYQVEKEQQVERSGILLKNYVMKKVRKL